MAKKTLLATIIIFMLVLSPAVPSNANRLTRRGNLLSNNNLGLSNQNVRIAFVANQIRRRVAFALVSFRLRPPWTGRDQAN
ncbi:hypothetical protein H5410_019042 [Solanum commersonii]|uniref:Uncharacterized protein n=1 Tax=Solanum commersonii TaxID=4109 RepID=A0A9J6A4E8_SOLCO|nr:hypothetical protein H5410_019042 [Solanum commersonii]